MYNPKNLIELYSGNDLDTLFKGNFINFGYWENVPTIISEYDVITANKNLYQQVFQRLQLTDQDHVLELGSGHAEAVVLFYLHFILQKKFLAWTI